MQRTRRLGRGTDLALALRRGRMASMPLFLAVWRFNRLEISRFAFIVPRTVDKRAVVRNRLRRRMSEYVRTRVGNNFPALDVVITCRKGTAAVSRSQFYDAFKELIFRISRA